LACKVYGKSPISSKNNVPPAYYSLDVFGSPNTFVEITGNNFTSYRFNNSTLNVLDFNNTLINFTQSLNTFGTDLSKDIRSGFNRAEVNVSSNIGLNKSAIITFYGLSTTFSNPTIYRDGVPCPSNICINLTSLNAGNVSFIVPGWYYLISFSCTVVNCIECVYKR
jgi:hypothetical protein